MKKLVKKHLIIFIVSIGVLIASFTALLRFTSLMKAREDKVIDARDRLASFEQNKRIFYEEAQELEEIKERIALLEQYLVTSESIPGLLSSLEDMASAKGVELLITNADVLEPQGENSSKLRVNFSATGSFSNIQLLIDEMLSQSYQVDFTRFSLHKSGAGDIQNAQESSAVVSGGSTGSDWQLLAAVDVLSF